MIFAAGTGFSTAFALILAIGAQNAFVLRQGVMRSHVFWVCLICAVSDAILITAGILGFGAVTTRYPALPVFMAIGGALFLIVYGLMRFRAALKGSEAIDATGQAQPLRAAILTCLAFTWANPHVYLDTLALIGAVSTAFAGPDKLAFGLGAISASFVFFFSLGYGARLLAPLLQSPRSWQILDILIGLLMWAIALGLILPLLA